MARRATPKQLSIIRLLGSHYELIRTVFEYADGRISTRIRLCRYVKDDRTQRLKVVDNQAVRERTLTCLLAGGWVEEKEQHPLGVKTRSLNPVVRAVEVYYRLTDKGRAAIHAA
jgi:hypothetical protein